MISLKNSKYAISPEVIIELCERLNIQIPYGPPKPFHLPEISKIEPDPPEVQAQMDILHERYVCFTCEIDKNNIVHIIEAEED